jgi:hypothetical protein
MFERRGAREDLTLISLNDRIRKRLRPETAKAIARPGLHELRIKIEASAIVYFAAGILSLLATIATIATAVQLYWAFKDRDAELLSQREEQIERSWTHLMAKMGGHTGKGASLSLLLKNGVPLLGVTLSCKSIGEWDTTKDKCVMPPILFDVVIPPISDHEMLLIRGEIRGLPIQVNTPYIQGLVIHNLIMGKNLIDGRFAGNKAYLADLSGSTIKYGAAPNMYYDCDLTDAHLSWSGNSFFSCNFSGARETLRESGDAIPQHGSNNWYWADRPPMERLRVAPYKWEERFGLERYGEMQICDPRFRDDHNRQRKHGAYPSLKRHFEAKSLTDFRIVSSVIFKGHQERAIRCPYLTMTEAQRLFPESYKSRIREAKHD